MSMRLLPKSEVNKAQAAATKQQIDEGLKIARRIDNLRELYAEEEHKLDELRRTKAKQYHDETEEALAERNAARKERDDARTERDELRKPLDSEWKELREAQALQQTAELHLNERVDAVIEREIAVQGVSQEAGRTLARAKTKEDKAVTLLAEIEADRKETERAKQEAQEAETWAKETETKMRADLTERDNKAAFREKSLDLREDNLRKDEEELAKGWKLLRDREAMFERKINRLKT